MDPTVTADQLNGKQIGTEEGSRKGRIRFLSCLNRPSKRAKQPSIYCSG